MSKRPITVSRDTSLALEVLGQRIRQGRTTRGWSQAELATRIGVSKATIAGIERGAPTVAVGHVIQAAFVAGMPLFGIEDPARLAELRRQGEDVLALLPAKVHTKGPVTHDGDNF